MKRRGRLIVIDGSDGVGKGTQTKLLVARLKREGHTVRTMDFPQYEKNFFGKFIGRALSGAYGNFLALDAHFASVLYAADRFESRKKIEGWLSEGAIVILDRYVSASQIHQGGKIHDPRKRKEFLDWLDALEHKVFGMPRPDIVLYLHIPFPLSIHMLKTKGKRPYVAPGVLDMAERNKKHLEDTQKAAESLLKVHPTWKKITCFNAKGVLSREAIHEVIYSTIRRMI
jgi:dTMP kinase